MHLNIFSYNKFLSKGGTPFTNLDPKEQVIQSSVQRVNDLYASKLNSSNIAQETRYITENLDNNSSKLDYFV